MENKARCGGGIGGSRFSEQGFRGRWRHAVQSQPYRTSSASKICIHKFSIFRHFHQFNMADDKQTPVIAEPPKGAPPSYEAAAIEHGDIPVRAGPPPTSKPVPRGPFPLDIAVLNQLRGKRIILASQSPRRKQIISTVLPPPGSPLQSTY